MLDEQLLEEFFVMSPVPERDREDGEVFSDDDIGRENTRPPNVIADNSRVEDGGLLDEPINADQVDEEPGVTVSLICFYELSFLVLFL